MARPEFEVPEFVSESDSDQIQERMMGNLPADISDMEGDFPYDFTMPTAIEISQLVQFNLVRCLMVAFPEYSWGDWMDLHGGEAGVTRKEAVAATGTVSVTAAYGTVLAAGTVFAVPATDQMEAVEFRLCELLRSQRMKPWISRLKRSFLEYLGMFRQIRLQLWHHRSMALQRLPTARKLRAVPKKKTMKIITKESMLNSKIRSSMSRMMLTILSGPKKFPGLEIVL